MQYYIESQRVFTWFNNNKIAASFTSKLKSVMLTFSSLSTLSLSVIAVFGGRGLHQCCNLRHSMFMTAEREFPFKKHGQECKRSCPFLSRAILFDMQHFLLSCSHILFMVLMITDKTALVITFQECHDMINVTTV